MRFILIPAVLMLAAFFFCPTSLALSSGFVENQGQAADPVLYYATGSQASVYFTRHAIVFDMRGERGADGTPARGCALHMRFAHAQRARAVEGCRRLPGRSHYFIGDVPTRWHTDVPSYAEIVYRDLWPGMDLKIRMEQDGIAYEIIPGGSSGAGTLAGAPATVAPVPTDPFVYEGVDRVVRLENGATLLETELGDLLHIRPSATGVAGHLSIQDLPVSDPAGGPAAAHDRLSPAAAVAADTRSNPDALLYGTFLGGSGNDGGYRGAVDDAGRAIASGYAQSSNFPVTPGAYDVTANGMDAFVAKLSALGDSLLWCTYVGGSSTEYGRAVALDASDNVVLAGFTSSTDFPTTAGAYDRTHNGSNDLFIVKLAAEGNALIWGSYLGGSSADLVQNVVLDGDARCCLTGSTSSSNFPTTSGAYDTSPNGGDDVFLLKFAADGSSLLWSTVLGGASYEYGWEVNLDPAGNPIVSGYATDGNFPTTAGAYDRTYNGGDRDAFVAKFSPDGHTLIWSSFLGGSDWDWSYGLAVDDEGCPVAVGGTRSSNFPATPGAYDVALGTYDVFVTKFSDDGDSLRWSTFLGGSSAEEAYDVALDAWGHPIVTGYVASADFPVTDDAYDDTYNGNGDAFVSKLSETGSELLWSSYFGGSLAERGWSVALDAARDPVVFGQTESSLFPVTPDAFDPTPGGGWDAFVFKAHMRDPSSLPARWETDAQRTLFCGPNPFLDGLHVRCRMPAEGPIDLRLLDVSGRVVATLRQGRATAGEHVLSWNGRDDRGRLLPSGAYYLRLAVAGSADGRWITLVR